jgi:signal transduction histidine kinase
VDRQTVELSSLGFQALVTTLLVLVNLGLWRQQHRDYFISWAGAWACYAARLGCISAYLVTRDTAWLFAHQLATGGTALLLLWAALQFSQQKRFRWSYTWVGVATILWAALALYGVRNFVVGGIISAAALSGVTLWTGYVFWRHRRRTRSASATLLAWTFFVWGFHHLDYPLLRPLGAGVLFGVFADVLFIVVSAAGMLFLALSEGREALEARRGQLEQLTRLLLRAQEDERSRLARELHDEAGQILTAAKIELDLDGRTQAAALVERALKQVRSLSHRLRPSELDDLGLLSALRGLVDDFGRRSRIATTLSLPESFGRYPPDLDVALYRVAQEALTNAARHAAARHVEVTLHREDGLVRLTVEDDGIGASGEPPPHLGLLGIRERLSAFAGTLQIVTASGQGFRLVATIPLPEQV